MVAYGKTSTMLRTMHRTGLLMMVGLMAGCAHMYDVTDEHLMKWKCCHDAKMAWLRCRDLYADVCYPYDFGAGFRAGYESVCMGGNGCPPAMPPRHYWSICYQCEEGTCQVMAWYDGFHHGVLAAQCDGCEGRGNILCAHDLYGEKPCEVNYNDIEVHVQPAQEHPGPEFGPTQMPYDGVSTPPAPAVPDYTMPPTAAPELATPPTAGTYQGDFGMDDQTDAPTIPGLRDMLEQNAETDVYPTF